MVFALSVLSHSEEMRTTPSNPSSIGSTMAGLPVGFVTANHLKLEQTPVKHHLSRNHEGAQYDSQKGAK